jgi:hypothetical protein
MSAQGRFLPAATVSFGSTAAGHERKTSAMVFPRQKSTRFRSISLLLAEASGLGFRVTAGKKGIFSIQHEGCLECPTFSTIGQKLAVRA